MKQTDEIINKEFSRSFMGYDMQEVDSFLDDIIERFEKLESERKEMLKAMEYMLKKLEAYSAELPQQNEKKRLNDGESNDKIAANPVMTGPVRVQHGVNRRDKNAELHAETSAAQTIAKSAQQVAADLAQEMTEDIVPVAIEMETEENAPDIATLIPDLLSQMEAVMDEGKRRTSGTQPMENADPQAGDSKSATENTGRAI